MAKVKKHESGDNEPRHHFPGRDPRRARPDAARTSGPSFLRGEAGRHTYEQTALRRIWKKVSHDDKNWWSPQSGLLTSREAAHEHRIEKLPLVDKNYRLKGLITTRDMMNTNIIRKPAG